LPRDLSGPQRDHTHPHTELNGHPTQRLANPTSITLHGIESEALLILLDQEGICTSSGSACLADSDEPCHVVKAIRRESAASRQMIRFSLGLENTHKDVNLTFATGAGFQEFSGTGFSISEQIGGADARNAL
jgi:cysteine sulfinate desulfinase/cysteine desulfurase-like protein